MTEATCIKKWLPWLQYAWLDSVSWYLASLWWPKTVSNNEKIKMTEASASDCLLLVAALESVGNQVLSYWLTISACGGFNEEEQKAKVRKEFSIRAWKLPISEAPCSAPIVCRILYGTKLTNSCYRSWAHCQIFLCLERHTNEAKGSIQCRIDPFASVACQTADNCDKSYCDQYISIYAFNFSRTLNLVLWPEAKTLRSLCKVLEPGVLPEKFGDGMRRISQNPYPIYDQNLRFSLPYLWPDQKFNTLFLTASADTVAVNTINLF